MIRARNRRETNTVYLCTLEALAMALALEHGYPLKDVEDRAREYAAECGCPVIALTDVETGRTTDMVCRPAPGGAVAA